MKPLSAKETIKVLEANGFWQLRQKGSHMIFTNLEGVTLPVPMHGKNKKIPVGTFMAIIKQSKIDRKNFKK